MGTRGAIGFKIDNEYKVTYNHFDSYPEGLGEEVVDFCRSVRNWKLFKDRIRKVKLVSDFDPPTKSQIKKYKKYADPSVSTKQLTEWYVLLRKTQYDKFLKEINSGRLQVMIDNFTFLQDSLFCEFAYILNLDNMTLELYRGFNKKKPNKKTYPLPFDLLEKKDDYYPVAYLGSYPLKDIPNNWTKIYKE